MPIPRRTGPLFVALSAALLAVQSAAAGGGECPPQHLTESQPGDEFGVSAILNGQSAIIGAWFDDDGASNAGSAHIYRLVDGAWVHETKVTAPGFHENRWLGVSVSIDGDVAVAGAMSEDNDALDAGAAYVYRFDGALWALEERLAAPDLAPGDYFGCAVSVDGDVVAVGSRWDDDNGAESGSVYVYRHQAGRWSFEQKLTAPDAAANEWLGTGVLVDGDLVIVGACDADAGGIDSGAVYVYQHDGTAYVFQQKLIAPDGADEDDFGFSLAREGNVILIGARVESNENGMFAGSAYVFRYDGASWQMTQKLLSPAGEAGDQFGNSLDLSGNRALVGAWQANVIGPNSGSAFLFQDQAGVFVPVLQLEVDAVVFDDWFGAQVGLSGDNAMVLARADDINGGVDAGSAYMIDLGCGVCPADVDGDGDIDVADLVAVILAWGQPGGPEDINRDGVVNVLDLVEVALGWGKCAEG
jgi:hypothetical protein